MALRDGELTHTDQAVHLAGVLVAEQGRGLAQTHGQLTVGALAVQVDLILEGAGHGTQGKALLGLVVGIAQDEHAVQVVVPVAADLVQVALGHQGGLGQQVAPLLLGVLHPALQQLDGAGAVGQHDRQALADHIHRGEVLQLTADLVVVPLEGLFLLLQVLLQLAGLGEGDAVHAAQAVAIGVAAPVGAGGLGQLHGLHRAGAHQVRAGAQVHEVALLVNAQLPALLGVLFQ